MLWRKSENENEIPTMQLQANKIKMEVKPGRITFHAIIVQLIRIHVQCSYYYFIWTYVFIFICILIFNCASLLLLLLAFFSSRFLIAIGLWHRLWWTCLLMRFIDIDIIPNPFYNTKSLLCSLFPIIYVYFDYYCYCTISKTLMQSANAYTIRDDPIAMLIGCTVYIIFVLWKSENEKITVPETK